MVNKQLYDLGFREVFPEPYKGVSSDRIRLFLQEYAWLRKQPCDRLAKKLSCYHFMKDDLQSELILNGRDATYLDKIKVEAIKQMWVEKAISHNPIWADRIAHWILWNNPEWFDCFPVEIKVSDLIRCEDGSRVLLVKLNPFAWEIWVDENFKVFCFRKGGTRRPSKTEENHAWKSCVILEQNLAYIPNKTIMEQINGHI